MIHEPTLVIVDLDGTLVNNSLKKVLPPEQYYTSEVLGSLRANPEVLEIVKAYQALPTHVVVFLTGRSGEVREASKNCLRGYGLCVGDGAYFDRGDADHTDMAKVKEGHLHALLSHYYPHNAVVLDDQSNVYDYLVRHAVDGRPRKIDFLRVKDNKEIQLCK